MKSELIALDTTCLKVEWLKELLSEFYSVSRPILLDLRSTIEILKQKNSNKMNKHIQIRLKSVQRLLG